MVGLSAAHGILQDVGKSSRFDWLKIISLFVSIPVFKLCYLAFKLSISLQQKRLLLIRRERVLMGFDDDWQEFGNLGLNDCSVPQAYNRLCHAYRAIQRREA